MQGSVCARTRTGRALFTLSLGNTDAGVLYLGCVSGCEVGCAEALMRIFEDMCRAYRDSTKLCGIRLRRVLDERGVVFVPCVNPDAMEINAFGPLAAGNYASAVEALMPRGAVWCANAAGVDLNHNISPEFKSLRQAAESVGYTAPGARFYAGKAPLTEPETRGIAQLCENHNIRHIMQIGQGENALYSAGSEYTEKCALISEILSLCSGCAKAEKSRAIDKQYGFADWFSQKNERPAFALNLSDFAEKKYKCLCETVVLSAVM